MTTWEARKRARRSVIAALFYVFGAFMTGANYANHRGDKCSEVELNRECADGNFLLSVYSGAVWPAYWLGRFSLWATR